MQFNGRTCKLTQDLSENNSRRGSRIPLVSFISNAHTEYICALNHPRSFMSDKEKLVSAHDWVALFSNQMGMRKQWLLQLLYMAYSFAQLVQVSTALHCAAEISIFRRTSLILGTKDLLSVQSWIAGSLNHSPCIRKTSRWPQSVFENVMKLWEESTVM